ncbi:MAG: CoA transferase [Sphingomonadaceae bacterium]|nr:CoA transferase [Sphingomonadaceae bacterium]
MSGALAGLRIVEFVGLGPGPFAAMMLADHGAEVIRVERPGGSQIVERSTARSRRSITVDLKQPEGLALVKDLCRSADGLIEGFRPGVMERLGLGPDALLADNSRLVYGRMTGWGQDGPLAQVAGHDINYIALVGVLHMIGRKGERPVPPLNLVGDFGGGGMLLAFGMVTALLAVRMGRPGQVVDAAMTDGAALLAMMQYGLLGEGGYHDEAGTNWLDGGAHYYDTYACADGRWISIGAIEPQFYALLRETLGLADDPAFDAHEVEAAWPILKQRLAEIFATKTRDAWCALMEGTDVCFAPVLSMREAQRHPHNVARATFIEVDGVVQPGPAPRFSATPAAMPRSAPASGADSEAVARVLGYDDARVAALKAKGVLG